MNLNHLFADTITYSVASSFSDGDFSQGAQTTTTGRLEETYEVVTIASGEERTTTHKFATTTAIALHSLVWISGADTADQGDALRILKRKYAATLSGEYSYYVYWLGR